MQMRPDEHVYEMNENSLQAPEPPTAALLSNRSQTAPKSCLVTGALLPWTGGPVRSIGAFQRALDASVVSFTDCRDVRHHVFQSSSCKQQIVHCTGVPAFSHFLVPKRSSLRAARRLVAQADMVSCHSFYTAHPAWMYGVCREVGIPYWIVPHGIFDPYVMRRNCNAKRIYMAAIGRACLANAAATVFSTRAERDKAMKMMRVANPVVVHWPVEIPVDCDRVPIRKNLRAKLGLPNDTRLLLYLGRLHPMKRPLETIELFSSIRDRSWHMLLVGHSDGISEQDCRKMAARCGIEDRVHLMSGVPATAVADVIRACDLFVSYSFRENFNNAAAECMATGLPILLSRGNDLVADLEGLAAAGTLPELRHEAVATLRHWMVMTDEERVDRGREGRTWAARNLSFGLFRERLLMLQRDTLLRPA